MKDVLPPLEELAAEHPIIRGALALATERLSRGKRLPKIMADSVVIWSRAYIVAMKKYYPGNLADEVEELKAAVREFRRMYRESQKQQKY